MVVMETYKLLSGNIYITLLNDIFDSKGYKTAFAKF